MQFYNTMSRKKETFTPVRKGLVGVYACGITAYALSHIGHARSAVAFDILVRLLRYKGYEVTFVRNFTDVDDKIIKRANDEGVSSTEIAETYIKAYHEDMDRLGVIRADIEPRATEHIQEMLNLTERLIADGKAYATPSGDVYFRVRSFPGYGKLSGRTPDDLRSGARVVPGDEKEDPLDFALWKSAKPGEPYWESPWGKGRPGWHIECSAMSNRYLGKTIDIHCGGSDLAFPHHENEIAQSEAANGCKFVNYWLHNGFINIDNKKMSKSLGNCIYLGEDADEVKKKVMSMFTDPNHLRVEDPGQVEDNPVFIYLDAFSRPEHFERHFPDYQNIEEMKAHYTRGGLGDMKVKKFLNNVLQDELEPIRNRRRELEKDIPAIYDILKEGSMRAREAAARTLDDVRRAMKINYFEDMDLISEQAKKYARSCG